VKLGLRIQGHAKGVAAGRSHYVSHRLGFISVVGMLGVGLLLLRFSKAQRAQLIAGLAILLGAFLALLVSISVIPFVFIMRNDFASGKTTAIEGAIENFRPALKIGPATESFSVGDVTLTYNTLDDSPCFHNRKPFDGIIHD
jgi:hypothetical protein